ncbi:MAG: bacteriohemerythrin [Treponema sp.]|jgi:hemerythrin|nr:bacteriohemerythrin [Treponema sp.]
MADEEYVVWSKSYETGIPLIDNQHKKLVALTNQLYDACLAGRDTATEFFLRAVHEFVDYAKEHFSAEEELMKQSAYSHLAEHKAKHDEFVKKLLNETQEMKAGNPMVPLIFLHYLRSWILSHIAIDDMDFVYHSKALKKEVGILFRKFAN